MDRGQDLHYLVTGPTSSLASSQNWGPGWPGAGVKGDSSGGLNSSPLTEIHQIAGPPNEGLEASFPQMKKSAP